MSSINLVNNSILATTRQENNSIINYILFSEASPDKPRITQCKSDFPRKDTILQKQTSFKQNLRNANSKSLKHKPSKLDLIDDTKLTSLPLPPPPKTRSSVASKPGKEIEPKRCLESLSTHTIDDDYDEGVEESEDPIVLVEDYVTSETEVDLDKQRHINKKDSLAIFKDRIYQRENSSSSSAISATSTILSEISNSKTNLMTCISNDKWSKIKITKKEQDLEEIFGKIPGADSLKYCQVCEKPLYEISSLIDNKVDSSLEHPTNDTLLYKENANFYSEFVCWECIETYEDFFNEMSANEMTNQTANRTFDKNNIPTDSITLLKIFQNIDQKYNIQNSSFDSSLNKHNEDYFSSNLIQKLYLLNSSAGSIPLRLYNGSETFDWIKYLKYQLRWRWRIAGLIPKVLRSEPDKN